MYTLLVPKEKSRREKKTGGGPFWKSYWEKEVQQNPTYYASQYQKRVSALSNTLTSFKNKYKESNRRYYAEIKLDKEASSKSKEPTALWTEAGLDIVETRERNGETFYTVSGTSEDFKKLEQITQSATFDNAYEGKGKAQDMARQIFAVTEIYDKNGTIENRVSHQLRELIKSNYAKSLDCIITIHYERKLSEYDTLFDEISQKIGEVNLHKRDKEFFISNMSYRATVTIGQITELLSDPVYGYIARIKINPEFIVQRSTPNVNLNSIQVSSPLTNEQIVLIDSGVDNALINPLIAHSMNYLSASDIADKRHGTSVASRLLFGHGFFKKVTNGEKLEPVAKIVDVQVLHKKSDGSTVVDTDVLMKSIKEATNRVDATLYNLSIASREPVNEKNDIDDSTALIDSISSKKDVLFITAVGNQNGNYPLGYKGIFNVKDDSCNISAPSDAINALSVGSIAESINGNTICDTLDHPSPFTRRGGFRNDIKKPELVAYGGNVEKDPTDKYEASHLVASTNNHGVDIMDEAGFCRDTGTSLSAPIVTRTAALVLDYLKKSNLSKQLPLFNQNKANLTKALLIHSTSRIKQAKIKDEMVKRAYGFGKADHTSALFDDTEDTVTISYADAISFSEKRQKILIKLPDYLLGKSLEFTFTLVYNPPINTNFKEYKMINLQGSVGLIFPNMENGKLTGKTDVKPLAPSHSWDNYKSSGFNTIHFKKTLRKLNFLDLQIGIQMTVSNHLLNEMPEEKILQNYAVVLSIKDKTESGQLRSQLLQKNQLVELVENMIKVQV
jgi:subtilisin family serine protease